MILALYFRQRGLRLALEFIAVEIIRSTRSISERLGNVEFRFRQEVFSQLQPHYRRVHRCN
jgi:hypothetical protein